MTDALVIGAGPAGLTTAIALARRGVSVIVLEQDGAPLPPRAEDAFRSWERRGVPQLRHSHAFLARLRSELLAHAPDILDRLLASGGSELRFVDHLPATIADRTPRRGDDELVGLALRRATFEWVLRAIAEEEPRIEFRTGTAVRRLDGGAGRVTGAAGITAGVVVDATGRSNALTRWLSDLGARPARESEADVHLLYYSRFYRLVDGADPPPIEGGQLGADLGFVKYAVFPGDDRTFSLTIGIAVADSDLRGVRHPAAFDALVARLPVTGAWIREAVPITDEVAVMARMRNRVRHLVVDGSPVVEGLVLAGDAAVITNPLYGRGTSLALAHGFAVAALIAEGAGADQFDELTTTMLEPWYHASVLQDQLQLNGDAQAGFLGAVRADADVWRAFMRTFNLLDPPEAMLADPTVQARIAEVMAQGAPPAPAVDNAPDRDEVVSILNARV